MKNTIQNFIIRLVALSFLAFGIFGYAGQAFAQDEEPPTLDFEEDGHGADWIWSTFENGDNPPLEFIANPDQSGINTSETVAKFTARENGADFAGARSVAPIRFVLDETRDDQTITLMVWKTKISDFGVKLETASNWGEDPVRVSNTVTNEWEEIVLDFSERNNNPDGEPFNGISVFPDFEERNEDAIIYFDNISFDGFIVTEGDDNGGGEDGEPEVAAPTPTANAANVISVFSDAFDDVEGTNFNPSWGQSTQVSIIEIDGSSTLRYGNFNYQGTQFDGSIDASDMTAVRFDMWTSNASAVNFTVISPGPEEKLFPLDITHDEWVTYEIELDYFDNVDLADIFQLKFDGGDSTPTIFLDNIYFVDLDATSVENNNERPVRVDLAQNYPNPFNPTTQIQYTLPESGHVRLDVFNMMGQRVATVVNENVSAGTHTVNFDATDLSSGIYLYRLQSGSETLTRKMTLIK